MSKWEKLIQRILTMSKDMRFDELRKVLESYGYEMSELTLHIQKTGRHAHHNSET